MSKQQKKNDQKSVVKNPNNYQHDLDKQNTEKQIKEDKLSKKSKDKMKKEPRGKSNKCDSRHRKYNNKDY